MFRRLFGKSDETKIVLKQKLIPVENAYYLSKILERITHGEIIGSDIKFAYGNNNSLHLFVKLKLRQDILDNNSTEELIKRYDNKLKNIIPNIGNLNNFSITIKYLFL